MQARWERGELNQVSSQWSQVQQSLANQGIRVEPLQHGSNLSNFLGSNSNGEKQQNGTAQSHDRANILDNLIPLKTKSSAAKSNNRRIGGGGWQSWA